MENLNYPRAIRRSWFLLVIGLVLGGCAGWLVAHQTTPTYRATAEFSVGYVGSGSGDEIAARSLSALRAQAFVQIAGAPPVLAAALHEAGVQGRAPFVTADTSDDSSLFSITVTGPDRRGVAPVANAYQQILVPQMSSLVGSLGSGVRLTVVSPATTPVEAIAPRREREIALGAIGGILLGLLAALLIEALDRRLRSSDEVARIASLPLLGTVPHDPRKTPLPARSEPRSTRAEAYRQVRTAWFALEPAVQVLAVTSSSPAEGKTTVATNVATAASRAGHLVVVIDADLRRPRVAAVFGHASEHVGLAEVLTGRATLDAAIQHTGEAVPAILSAGAPSADPSELLASEAFEELVTALRERYDYVVIDTPPVLPVTDALVIAPRVDAVVVVARIRTTTRHSLERMLDALARVRADVVGVVVNDTRDLRSGPYAAGYYADTKPPRARRRARGRRAAVR